MDENTYSAYDLNNAYDLGRKSLLRVVESDAWLKSSLSIEEFCAENNIESENKFTDEASREAFEEGFFDAYDEWLAAADDE